MLESAPPTMDVSAILTELDDLETKRRQLEEVGLLDKTESASVRLDGSHYLDESTRRVLALYIQDTRKKLEAFDSTADKVQLFLEIVNRHFRDKTMRLSRQHGFVFPMADGVTLTPTQLSSGEQHELIVTYDFIFKAQGNSLVLIDEPEMSLHIEWQQAFLSDLLQITRLNECQVIAATHSPDIVHGNWHIMRTLDGDQT